jgi:hypothetical protein
MTKGTYSRDVERDRARNRDTLPPTAPDHSEVQDCGDPTGASGNRPASAFNDVRQSHWARGGSEKPSFDHENSWKQGRNPKLRDD